MEGTMLWFNLAKQQGFIRTDDGERLLVNADGFAAGEALAERCSGTRVRFDRVADPAAEARATNVVIVPSSVGRRARMRGHS